MSEFLIEYKDSILQVCSFVYIPFLAFLVSLAGVYSAGRMLELVHTNRSKNIVAFFILTIFYIYYFTQIKSDVNLQQAIWFTIVYSSISILFYVILGFKLYDRMDALLDKVMPDPEEPKKPSAKKKGPAK
jgi:hypothetical protein